MSQQIANIHDAFFKNFMGEPRLAQSFLREHLPPEVAELLALEAPERLPGSFVDEKLAQHHSDLLFRVRMKTPDEALVYVLLEHKSAPDHGTPLQLLRYIVRILANWYDENERLPLPVVLPIVAHQGPAGWKLSTHFIDMFGSVPEPLRPYLVSFRHGLVDLAGIDDGAFSVDPRLCAYLKMMKYVQRRDLPERLEVILVPELRNVDVKTILGYIAGGPIAVSRDRMQTALRNRLGRKREEEIMGHFTQEYIAEGRAQGRAEGEAVGLVAGESRALIRVLEKRFGPVPSHFRELIFAADAASIEGWIDRAVEVHDMQSVFQMTDSGT